MAKQKSIYQQRGQDYSNPNKKIKDDLKKQQKYDRLFNVNNGIGRTAFDIGPSQQINSRGVPNNGPGSYRSNPNISQDNDPRYASHSNNDVDVVAGSTTSNKELGKFYSQSGYVNSGGPSLNIRSGPGTGFPITGSLSDGSPVSTYRISDDGEWVRLVGNHGWVKKEFLNLNGRKNNTKSVTQSSNTGNSSNTNKQAQVRADVQAKINEENKKYTTEGKSAALDDKFKKAMMRSSSVERVANLNKTIHIFGAPFQYTPEIDFRPAGEMPTGNGLGRRYGETIMCEPPVVNFIPCVPMYLGELNKETKKYVSEALDKWNKGSGVDEYGKSGLDAIFKKNSEVRYFTAAPAYPRYARIVNLLCRALARFMELHKQVGPDGVTTLDRYKWETYKWEKDKFKLKMNKNQKKPSVFEKAKDFAQQAAQILSYNDISVPFYVDPSTSINESYSNSTTQSQFAGMVGGLEGVMKDYAFFTGAVGANTIQGMPNAMANASDTVTQYAALGDGLFRRFLRGTADILRGSNLIFPDIWSDSSPSRSVSVSMNFTSPYGDPLSIYLHVLVPLMHVIPLFAPIQASANAYSSPFLVKANSKGWFNVDMGMIDSVSIDKAPDGQWTMDGYPLTIKVNLGISDLYRNFMVTSTHSPILFFKNDGLIEYLSVNGNVDLNRVHPEILLDIAKRMLFENVTDFPYEIAQDGLFALRTKAYNALNF